MRVAAGRGARSQHLKRVYLDIPGPHQQSKSARYNIDLFLYTLQIYNHTLARAKMLGDTMAVIQDKLTG